MRAQVHAHVTPSLLFIGAIQRYRQNRWVQLKHHVHVRAARLVQPVVREIALLEVPQRQPENNWARYRLTSDTRSACSYH
jgi:hypothetical protein